MKGIISALVILLVCWMLGNTYCYVCEIKDLCGGQEAVAAPAPAPKPEPKPVATTGFMVKDGSSAIANSAQGPFFDRSGSNLQSNPNLDNALQQIGQYLKDNGEKALTITGKYLPSETNYSFSRNLGEARAKAIRGKILGAVSGLDKDRIDIAGLELADLKFNDAGKTNGGLDFVFSKYDGDAVKNRLTQFFTGVKTCLQGKPKNFYFDTGSNQIALDEEMRTYFRELREYLDYDKEASVTLTGHTDSAGDAAANRALGQKRADRIKQYLIDNGISALQISTASKGEDAPIADNNTDEGKALNRRVEIRLD